MSLTFDEALKAIDEKSDMEPYSGLFLIEIEDAKAIVMKLANTYAPTIEMTEFEKSTLLKYVFGDNGNFFDLVEYETDYLYKKLSTSELMQAWLHPETIKIKEEE